jgi:hypothetical protein
MSAPDQRFTLHIDRWYAAEIIGDAFHEEGLRSYSPIRVDAVEPLGEGRRQFELLFFHLNYPAGVQSKRYKLQTLERGARYLLARCTEQDPVRILLIHEISWNWMEQHFPPSRSDGEPDLQRWLFNQARAF